VEPARRKRIRRVLLSTGIALVVVGLLLLWLRARGILLAVSIRWGWDSLVDRSGEKLWTILPLVVAVGLAMLCAAGLFKKSPRPSSRNLRIWAMVLLLLLGGAYTVTAYASFRMFSGPSEVHRLSAPDGARVIFLLETGLTCHGHLWPGDGPFDNASRLGHGFVYCDAPHEVIASPEPGRFMVVGCGREPADLSRPLTLENNTGSPFRAHGKDSRCCFSSGGVFAIRSAR
jgi:hypothetical protein